MQDRFKFRIFINNKIQEVFYFYKSKNGIIFACTDLENDTGFNIDGSTLMQCTGLKDKNGKLIYEGDIVRFKDNVTIKGSKTHIAAVEHNEAFNAFMYHAECMGLYTINKAQNEQYDVEVIGNIYENPELLED